MADAAETDVKSAGEAIAAALSGAVTDISDAYGELTLTVGTDRWVDVARYLREDPGQLYMCFIDLCAVDYPVHEKRFEVVLHLLSPKHNTRIRVKTSVDEETPVPSLCEVFPAAVWFEREAYDLVGVLFSNHPDLRRILTDYGFHGHSLRQA